MSESNVATQEKAKRTDSVPATVFAPIVQASNSVDEVIAKVKEATGVTMNESNVKIKMSALRKKIPHLKSFERKSRTRIDYAAIDAQLAEAQKEVEQAQAEQEKVEAESNG